MGQSTCTLSIAIQLHAAAMTAVPPIAIPASNSIPIPAAKLAPYPPMHWHSWNQFSGEATVTDANMREISASLISTGMVAAGYETINVVCNGWGARDPVTHRFTENKAKWPTGMKGLGTYLHSKGLQMGCYTAPGKTNCCGEPGSEGFEAVDMEFFAEIGCDHIMVDWCQKYVNPLESFNAYAKIGAAIANSSNPNMLYSIWETGYGKSWKWFKKAGGHFNRIVTDMSNFWEKGCGPDQPGSVLKNFDTAMSIPNIQSHTEPGHYSFLDNMIVGVTPGGHAACGPGLSTEEARSHFTMWVMAASPLLTNNDVRNMPADIKEILTNPEVLAIHKDPLVAMGYRIDVGGGVNEPHTTSLDVTHTVWKKPLSDGSVAVMILNRATMTQNVTVALEDVGNPFVTHYTIRDLWARTNLSSVPTTTCAGEPTQAGPPCTPGGYQKWHVNALELEVPAHGVRLLRMTPLAPFNPQPDHPPPDICPAGFTRKAPVDGIWSNPSPCGVFPLPASCITRDTENGTLARCGAKCIATAECRAFEVADAADCWIFVGELKAPFTAYVGCKTCVRDS